MPQHPEIPSLTHRAGRGVTFRLMGNLGTLALGLGLGVILARLLPPKEFGIFAVAFGIVYIVDIVGSCGMLQALVQRKTVTPEDEGTAAVLQMGAAVLLGGGLVLAGPPVEKFFGMPGIGALVQMLSAVLIINALGVVPTSRLTRGLAFNRLAATEISARALEGTVAILLALQGMGALALAVGSITASACRTSLVWIFAPGRVALLCRLQSAKNLVGYGTGILFSRTCYAITHRVDVLIIGHRLGPGVVGLYHRAFHLVDIPLVRFSNAISHVLFPAMASVQDADQRFRRGYLGAVGLTTMLAFPMLTLLWTTADLLIPLVYGPMWNETVPILVSLGFVGYLRIANNANGMVAKARGRSVAEAIREAIVLVSTALLVFLGTRFGVHGAVAGIGMANLLSLVMMTQLALSVSGVRFVEWLAALRTAVVGSVVMALALFGSKAILVSHMPIPLLLVVASCTGILVYSVSLRLLLSHEERQILERISTVLPARLRGLFHICIGSVPAPVPATASTSPLLLTEKPTLPKH